MKWQIWMESYCGLRNHCSVRLLGEIEALTFEAACYLVANTMEGWNAEDLTVWSCRLFPTKEEAEESYQW